MSLFPLGLLSQGGGGASAAYELIQTAYGDGSTQSITFSSIPQTYKHLQVRYVARGTGNTTNARQVTVSYNGQSSTFRSHVLSAGYGGAPLSETIGANYVAWIPELNGTSNSYGAGVIDLLDYTNASTNKTFRNFSGYYGGGYADGYPQGVNMVALVSGFRTTTEAISSLTFSSYNAFTSQTRFSLYGIKG